MTLKEFIGRIPYGQRGAFRRRLAKAHSVSFETVRKWENFPPPVTWSEEKVRDMTRVHPANVEAILLTEEMTGCEVTRFDLRPDIFQRDAGVVDE